MKTTLKKFLLVMVMMVMMVPSYAIHAEENIQEIVLNANENSDGTWTFTATVNGETVDEYDYTWHADPSEAHKDVKNSPAEYYTGEEPEGDIYIAHDIYYYPELDADKYIKVNYDGETEWVYYYEAEGYEDYIFATLPVEGNTVPTRMMHSEEEAYNNAVLHITKAGTYRLSGNWHGQVNIDLGEDSFDDPSAVVTLILDNVNIECTVASGICFTSVYEVDNEWEDREEAISTIDTTGAGANIIIADDSNNTVSGANIYRILKTKYKNEDSTDAVKVQKKSKKVDGAFYSYMSMNIDGQTKGNGVLNINSEFEGLDSELHLTINSGNINIIADNDGINVNEDYVSIFTMNGGTLQILAGTGAEGDGIDSNGYININGGTVISSARPQSDSGLDSDGGTYINGGTVIATGSSMDVVTEYSEDADQVTMNLVFSRQQNITDSIALKDASGKAVFGFDLSQNEFYKDSGRTYQCLIISDDSFKVGEDYTIYEGGTLKGDDTNGIYNSIKSIKNASQLGYTSTGNSNPFERGFGGMGMNGNFNQGEMPQMNGEMPEDMSEGFSGDFDPSELPEGEMPEMPEGMNQGEMPQMNGETREMPEGEQPQMTGETKEMPEGMGQGQQPQTNGTVPEMPGNGNFNPMDGNAGASTGETQTVFTAEDKVNTYSGVTTVAVAEAESGLPVWAIVAISVGSTVVVAGAILLIVMAVKKKKTTETE